jgi:hypothetical protein
MGDTMKTLWSAVGPAVLALTLAGAAAAAEKPGYRALAFTQYANQGYEFAIPESDVPVRVDLSVRLDGDKAVRGSLVLSALLTRDPYSGAVSWIATDSDGGTSAGNTMAGDTVVARIRAPGGGDYAVLEVAGGKTGKLRLVQKNAARNVKGYYSVRLWY